MNLVFSSQLTNTPILSLLEVIRLPNLFIACQTIGVICICTAIGTTDWSQYYQPWQLVDISPGTKTWKSCQEVKNSFKIIPEFKLQCHLLQKFGNNVLAAHFRPQTPKSNENWDWEKEFLFFKQNILAKDFSWNDVQFDVLKIGLFN